MDSNTQVLAGRVALVTGANTGIGRVTARELARQGAHVFIACRSAERAQPALAEIRAVGSAGKVDLLMLDLGDLDSIRRCAASFLALGMPLHLLINNAGLAGGRGLSPSGFELAFGVNHIGPFLLTQLLLERIKASAPSRVVTVASRAHFRATGFDWAALRGPTRSFTGVPEYGVSKLANVLFSAQLARRLEGSGVITSSLHPGVVASDIWRSLPWPLRALVKLRMISTEQGALTTLHCAISDSAGRESGLYYDKCKVKTPSRLAQNAESAADLWQRSEDWVR